MESFILTSVNSTNTGVLLFIYLHTYHHVGTLQTIYYLLNLWKSSLELYVQGLKEHWVLPCVLRALGRSGQEPSPQVLRSVQAKTPKWVGNKQFINEHESTSQRTASPPLVDMLLTFLKYRSNFPTSLCISGVGKLWATGQIWEVVCLIKLYRNITMCTVCILSIAVFIIQGLPSSALHIHNSIRYKNIFKTKFELTTMKSTGACTQAKSYRSRKFSVPFFSLSTPLSIAVSACYWLLSNAFRSLYPIFLQNP